MGTKRFAFTMLELIFVIVIMGILGTYGVEFLARAYDNFIFSKLNNDLQAKSASAVEFITKRLEGRINNSMRYVEANASWGYVNSAAGSATAIALEWIPIDMVSFKGTQTPLWTGVADITASNVNGLVSPGSNFSQVPNINNGVVYFLGRGVPTVGEGVVGNPNFDQLGFYTDLSASTHQRHTLHPVNWGGLANDTLVSSIAGGFVDALGNNITISEYYKLATTANAVVLRNYNVGNYAGQNMGDLFFVTNYRPWQGDTFNANGTSHLIARGVSAFRFRAVGNLVKIQVCSGTRLTQGYSICKEKTVF